MQQKEKIKKYTANELQEMRRKGYDLSDWQKLEMMSDEELEEIIAQDPDENDLNIDWQSASITIH